MTCCTDPQSAINRQWTAALGAIEGNEPPLTAVVAINMNVSLVNYTESSSIFLFVENAVLQEIINSIY